MLAIVSYSAWIYKSKHNTKPCVLTGQLWITQFLIPMPLIAVTSYLSFSLCFLSTIRLVYAYGQIVKRYVEERRYYGGYSGTSGYPGSYDTERFRPQLWSGTEPI